MPVGIRRISGDKAQETVDKLGEWLGPADKQQMDACKMWYISEQSESSENRQAAQSTPRDESSLET